MLNQGYIKKKSTNKWEKFDNFLTSGNEKDNEEKMNESIYINEGRHHLYLKEKLIDVNLSITV